MDKHLERNLQKVESLRARGDLAKARRRLAELVQEHPDTLPYRIELARACLDLGDAHAGLAEIRAALRKDPDSRADALALVIDHFRATGNLPAAQFLFEDHLSRDEHEEAALVLEPLAAGQLRQALERYATKLASLEAHRDLAAGSEGAAQRLALWGSFHLAVALKEWEAAAAHGTRLLRADERVRPPLLALLERRARSQHMPPRLLILLGEARAREGRAVEGLSALLAAGERERGLLAAVEAVVAEVTPLLTDATAVLRTRGHLARLGGRHEEAVALYREAVGHDPQGVTSLLELLAPAAEGDGPEARPYALLQVELLALSGDGDGLTAAVGRLRGRPWLDPADLRRLLCAHLSDAASAAVASNALVLAIEAGDLAGLESQLAAGPACGGVQTAPLTRALERRLGLPPVRSELIADPATGELVAVAGAAAPAASDLPAVERPRWLAALLRLHAAAGDAASVNARLPLLWAGATALDDEAWRALADLTRDVFAQVPPAPCAVAALLGPLAARGEGARLRPWLVAAAAGDAAEVDDLARALVAAARSGGAAARALRGALDGALPEALALPRAAARLFGGDEAAALGELAALAQTSAAREDEVLSLLLAHAALDPGHGAVALAAARMLRVEDRLDEAVALLGPLFTHAPQSVEEAGLFFESLLAAEPERADFWLAYLDGLAAAGRFRRLMELLPRAEQALPAAQIGRLRLYRARLQSEEGNLAGAVAECELALQLVDPPLEALADLLRAVLAADPGFARAHKLLGDVLGAAADLPEALRAHGRALRCDPALQAEVLHAVRRLAGGRLLGAAECLGLARFYLEAGRGEDAAAAYLETLQIDSARAAEVSADLADTSDDHAAFPALLQPLARAQRLLGRLEEAENACTALYARDTSRAEWIFRELALLEGAHPEALPPVRARARILLAERRTDEVPRVIAAALQRLGDVGARRLLGREFAAHLPPGVTLERLEAEADAAPAGAEPPAAGDTAGVAPPDEDAAPPVESLVEAVVAASLAPAPAPVPAPAAAADPVADAQSRRVAEAEQLLLAERPLEAIRRLRLIPLSGEECRLADTIRARALWLLAHAEEARGGWAAACACYRELTALPDGADGARRALNRCYGRLLQDSVAASPLVLEKTATLT